MIDRTKKSLPPEEVARIIAKTTGNASEFGRRIGINPDVARKYKQKGINGARVGTIIWAFEAIDKHPSLIGCPEPPGVSEFDQGVLTVIAHTIGQIGLPQARILLITSGLQEADISDLPEPVRCALLRLNTYHGINLIEENNEAISEICLQVSESRE